MLFSIIKVGLEILSGLLIVQLALKLLRNITPENLVYSIIERNNHVNYGKDKNGVLLERITYACINI